MYIILKQSSTDKDEILNIFYCQDETLIRNWIRNYIESDIKDDQDTKDTLYEINDAETNFQLIKKFKQINRGYIYNSSEKIAQVVYKISILEFNADLSRETLKENNKWADINNEINNRVLKRLDKNSLYQIITQLESKISTKSSWNRTEYVGLFSETIQNFKKNLYSSIAKRMRRFGKAQITYEKNMNKVPDNFNNRNGSCTINFLETINKK